MFCGIAENRSHAMLRKNCSELARTSFNSVRDTVHFRLICLLPVVKSQKIEFEM